MQTVDIILWEFNNSQSIGTVFGAKFVANADGPFWLTFFIKIVKFYWEKLYFT